MFSEKASGLKKWSVFVLSFILVLSLAACGGNNNSGNEGASGEEKLEKIRIGYLNVMDDAQAILAYQAGIYEKYGLDVEMQLFTSGTDLIKQMVGGQLDAGVLGFTNALSWIDKGSDLKIVGGAQMGFHAMLVHEDSGIETLDQLKGKSVASQKAGSTADVVLNGVVWETAGFDREDVTMQYVSPAVAIQSLAAEKVDAAFVFEPYSSIAQLTYPVKQIYEIGQEWPFPCMVTIATGEVVKENRELINKMLDAQKEAIEMLENEPAKAAEYITKEFIKEDELQTSDGGTVKAQEVIQASIESQEFRWDITEQDIQRMDEVAQMMVDQGILEKKIDVNQALDLTWQKQYE
ncbi:ABC transporter substrate-binding protein [Marinicrinis lubricantis]|uniref:ABC transporter substrate-binding protein n=1 Tax=Marinicrinis lubricantis TaxID=2086470 RepID=A0ABW1IV72_9BACL